jgi:hypothetical protein
MSRIKVYIEKLHLIKAMRMVKNGQALIKRRPYVTIPSRLVTPRFNARLTMRTFKVLKHFIFQTLVTMYALRHTAKALRPSTTVAPVKVLGGVRTKSLPATRTRAVRLLLRLVDLLLELRSARVDELELRELGVEDADDLCKLQKELALIGTSR